MKRLHPLTVPLRVLNALGSVVALLVFSAVAGSGAPELGPVLVGLGVLGAVALLGYQVAYYRRFTYEVTGETIDIASGVFSRQRREIPLGRIQNVDISEGVVQRLFGIAAVDFETAGGGSTEASLRYVGQEEARRLQDVVRGHAVAAAEGEAAGVDRSGTGPAGEPVFTLETDSLLVLALLSFDVRVFSLVQTGLAFASPAIVGTFLDLPVAARVPAAVLAVTASLVGGWLLGAAVTYVRYYGFRLTRLGEELRYERGLLNRYSGTIPLEKIQTVTVRENVLMRRFGYAALAVETAGYGGGEEPSGGSEAAVPLDDRAAVLALARELEPFEAPALEQPPARTRTRYTRRYRLASLGLAAAGAVATFVLGLPTAGYGVSAAVGVAGLGLAGPAAARGWRSRGVDLQADHAVTRNGWWRRRTTVVPSYRFQTVIDRRNLFQRRWDLATVEFDTAGSLSLGGPSGRAVDIDDARADALREQAADDLQTALRSRRRGTGPARPVTDGPEGDTDTDTDSDTGTGTGTGPEADPETTPGETTGAEPGTDTGEAPEQAGGPGTSDEDPA